MKEKVIRPMVRIAEMVRSKGAGMFYWAFPPRRTMYEDNRILMNRRLESNLNGLATQITRELENISWNQYLEECLVDGTHFNEDHCRNVLTNSLQVMGVNSSLFPRDIRIQLHDFIPEVCPACGENHPRNVTKSYVPAENVTWHWVKNTRRKHVYSNIRCVGTVVSRVTEWKTVAPTGD